jgi:thioredoxin-related protein
MMNKMKWSPLWRTVTLLAAVALAACWLNGCTEPEAKGPPIYDTQAEGEKLIADALVVAKRENKRVLAEFGANWCIWCRRLHAMLHTDPAVAPFFKEHFVLVMIDVDEVNGKTHNEQLIERYGNPIANGMPGLVLLDADGKQLLKRDTDAFMHGEHYDATKLLEFLKEAAGKPVVNWDGVRR